MSKKAMYFVVVLGLCLCIAVYIDGSVNKSSYNTPPAGIPSFGTIIPKPFGEKVLRIHRSWEEASWDPAVFRQADDVHLALQVYETLVKREKNGDLTPWLAESWSTSDDGLTVTMKLRQGVQWHHSYGEFSAEDVKYTFERHLDDKVGSINADNLSLQNITSIETPDKYTVVFNFGTVDVDFLTRCSLYYGYMLCKAAYELEGFDSMMHFPVGTGPFRYDSGTPGTKTEVVRFDDYWGEKAITDRVVSMIITDTNTAYAAFENGELDVMYVYDRDKVKEFESKGFINVHISDLQLLYVGVNMQLEPFTNEKVRAAFWCAINPHYYIEHIFYGDETLPGSYIPQSSKYSLPDYHKPVYDPEKSKKLLDEAGYPNGPDVTMWSVNDDYSPPAAHVSYSQLSDAGFNVKLQLVDFGVFINKVRNGEAPIWVLYNSTPILADETMNRYTSSFYPGSNWIGLQDDTYDKLVAAGLNARTEQEKYEKFHEAQRYLLDKFILYPVSTNSYSCMTQPNVTGIDLWADSYIRLNKVDFK